MMGWLGIQVLEYAAVVGLALLFDQLFPGTGAKVGIGILVAAAIVVTAVTYRIRRRLDENARGNQSQP